MFHNLGNPMRVKFINQYRYVYQYPALRHYYICRNHTYLETRFSQRFYRFTSWIRRIKSLFTRIFWITLYDRDDKYLKVWACLLGTYHGFIGKLGKLW
jgi:rhamnosyltransferase